MSLDWQELIPLIAHDGRALIRKGMTNAQLLERLIDPAASPGALTHLRAVMDAQTDLNRFFARLVALAEAHRPEKVPCEAADLLVVVLGAKLECKEAINKAGAEFVTGELPTCRVTKRSQLVLRELIENSLRFVDTERGVRIQIAAESSDETLRLSITDTGSGIEPEYSDKLFQPLQRLDSIRSGFGMGLAISRAIINGGQGRIYNEQFDNGAKFVFELPCH